MSEIGVGNSTGEEEEEGVMRTERITVCPGGVAGNSEDCGRGRVERRWMTYTSCLKLEREIEISKTIFKAADYCSKVSAMYFSFVPWSESVPSPGLFGNPSPESPAARLNPG